MGDINIPACSVCGKNSIRYSKIIDKNGDITEDTFLCGNCREKNHLITCVACYHVIGDKKYMTYHDGEFYCPWCIAEIISEMKANVDYLKDSAADLFQKFHVQISSEM